MIQWNKTIDYFKARDEYKVSLAGWISKYGLVNLPASVQRTVPTDRKVLYEPKWYLQPIVWTRIIQITVLNARKEAMKVAIHG